MFSSLGVSVEVSEQESPNAQATRAAAFPGIEAATGWKILGLMSWRPSRSSIFWVPSGQHTKSYIENGPLIVDLHMNIVISHSYVNVDQRVPIAVYVAGCVSCGVSSLFLLLTECSIGSSHSAGKWACWWVGVYE